ncbi:VOC family protein [Sphingobium scionense]|uniref:Catechol 2,3-dioxygenase-like lactoylglutathione lyase family enzyme n=1 Tax=Sphingobium scionense TaxID=1404341 RepID=A0A7W6LPD6_9SPHN|nr:VOC family protein [Sphingobium scionense]MBB4147188.1 catechol 2,3-dioxygenase-like lactoylglutathione lyase family enzyme [Sphingobium scionense]
MRDIALLLALLPVGAAPLRAQTPPPVGATLMAPGLPVADLDKALRFYQVVLGLVPATTLQHGPVTEVMLCADGKGGRLALILLHDTAKKAPPTDSGIAKIVLRVPDLSGVAARMQAAGYPVGAIRASGKGPAILMIHDPDGHELELVGNPPAPA